MTNTDNIVIGTTILVKAFDKLHKLNAIGDEALIAALYGCAGIPATYIGDPDEYKDATHKAMRDIDSLMTETVDCFDDDVRKIMSIMSYLLAGMKYLIIDGGIGKDIDKDVKGFFGCIEEIVSEVVKEASTEGSEEDNAKRLTLSADLLYETIVEKFA